MTVAWTSFADALLHAAVAARSDAPQAPRPDPAPSLEDARQVLHASLADGGPFAALASNAELDPGEAEVLALLVATEMSLERQRMVAFVQDDGAQQRLTVQTIAGLFGDVGGAALVGYGSGLRRAALIEVVERGPWGQHELIVAPSVMWALVGDGGVEPDLPDGVESIVTEGDGHGSFVVVSGRDRLRRRQAGGRVAAADRLVVSPAPVDDPGWAALVREATLTGAGLLIELVDPLSAAGKRWVDDARHLTWVLSARNAPDLDELPRRDRVEVEADDDPPTDEEWIAAFGPDEPRTHPVMPEQLADVARAYSARSGDLDAAVRRLVGNRLETLARRVRPRLGWDDIVLAPDRLGQLREIADVFRNSFIVYDQWGFDPGYSRGLVALFSGPSGAGKTLSAEVIANELGLDIFKVEISAVVSKYIGETEKNLEQLFDAASAGNLVLFFDEADALFGKRAEVSDARDRYANIEVSYLLQRLERYDGIVILATNFEKNLDDAFLRRIHTRVDFVLPGEAERLAIWRLNLPPSAPIAADVDLADLASRFSLSGASIKNAALHGAFLAAAERSEIRMEHLVIGVAGDYRKVGRLLKADEFGPYHAAVAARVLG